jgi:hypothetical protein
MKRMDIRDYWSLPRSGQGSQDEIIKELTPPPGHYAKVYDISKAMEGINPCIALYGYGPEGAICRDCTHCRYRQDNPKAKHWKCDLRKLTHGAATDHRVGWPACGRYEKRTEEYHGG